MKKTLLIFLFICFWIPGITYSQELWRNTSYGMTVEEVRKIIPEASPPYDTPSKLYNGAEEMLRINELEIVNNKFKASFYFLDNKLYSVNLSLLEKDHPFYYAMGVFNSLAEVFRSKYGAELSKKIDDQNVLMKSAKAVWTKDRTNIDLTVLSVKGEEALLVISYQARLANEADKL